MTEEFDALFKNYTQDLVDLSLNKSMVGCKWVFKIKTCLVTKGFTQKYGIDYEETFSLIGHLSFVCTLMAITASYQWNLFQMDVKNVFLNGDLSGQVYM